jgi:hypothetical protein
VIGCMWTLALLAHGAAAKSRRGVLSGPWPEKAPHVVENEASPVSEPIDLRLSFSLDVSIV